MMSTSPEMDTKIEEVASTVISTVPTRRVRFPSDESQLRMISIAPEPFANQPLLSLGVILQRYRATCQRLQIRPLNSVVEQLATIDDFRRSYDDRLLTLKLRNEKIDIKQMDAIEEVLSRSRFHQIDLESAVFDDATLIQLIDVIEYYESCTHLNLSNHRSIGPQGYQALTRYLRRTRCLERLDMNSVRFDETNMFAFGRALRLASTLYELHVESCQLNGKLLQKFIQNLRACPTIRELYLCDNRLQVQDAPFLNELIRSCGKNLRLLDLRGNMLQDNGIAHLASQFSQYDENHKEQNLISHISFQANQLTQHGIGFLGKCLIHNRSIRSLNLSQNNLTNEGLYTLRDALLSNRTISELMLRNCRLTDQAAIALAEYIAESATIQYIDLRENNIQISGICGLAIAMKSNRSLLRLDVDSVSSPLTSSSNSNGDRSTTGSGLLSLSSLRRMTVGFGSSTSNSQVNGSGTPITDELIEQKSKWINDINAICERNMVIYDEQMQERLEAEERLNQVVFNVTDEEKTEIFNEVFDQEPQIDSIEQTLDQQNSVEPNEINQVKSSETIETNGDVSQETVEAKEEIASETVESKEEILSETIESKEEILSEMIENDENPDENDGDEKQQSKRKLRHSDSLHLLRRKTQTKPNEIMNDITENQSPIEDQANEQC